MSLYHSDIGPWGQFAGLVLRTDRRIDIQIWNDPEVTAYRVWGSPNPDDLYGNPAGSGVGGTIANRQMMFQDKKRKKFISPGLRRNVITSYSIHYTKLYEFPLTHRLFPRGQLFPVLISR